MCKGKLQRSQLKFKLLMVSAEPSLNGLVFLLSLIWFGGKWAKIFTSLVWFGLVWFGLASIMDWFSSVCRHKLARLARA